MKYQPDILKMITPHFVLNRMLTFGPSPPFRNQFTPIQSHRRASSAPNYVDGAERLVKDIADRTVRRDSEQLVSPYGADTHDTASPKGNLSDSGVSNDQSKEAYCMFVKNCDTGSQLRKAISHLFGRNKSCTLKIPKHVWVYYCRKHYQRVRYRNAKTYPLNQMDLVKLQIHRLQSWSMENKRNGDGPYIRVWTLSLRKREQNRIESGADRVEDRRGSVSSAVPEWLIQRVGTGYTTEQMLEVADRLYEEIKAGRLAQIPEIEFLPDIVEDTSTITRVGRNRKMTDPSRILKRKADQPTDQLRRASLGSALLSDDGNDVEISIGKRSRLNSHSLPPLQASVPYNHHDVRGQAGIPRIPPMDYRRQTSYGGYATPPNYQQPLSASSEPEEVYHHNRYPSQHPLPPLHSHLPTPPHHFRGAEHQDHSSQHMHSRSSSAYTLASRAPTAYHHRPSTSGNEPGEPMHSGPAYTYEPSHYAPREVRPQWNDSHYDAHRPPQPHSSSYVPGRTMPPIYNHYHHQAYDAHVRG